MAIIAVLVRKFCKFPLGGTDASVAVAADRFEAKKIATFMTTATSHHVHPKMLSYPLGLRVKLKSVFHVRWCELWLGKDYWAVFRDGDGVLGVGAN